MAALQTTGAMLAAAGLMLTCNAASAEMRVVTTIKPVHALAAEIVTGVGTATVLVDGNASPHNYAMKPSDAKAVGQADVLIRVSESLEPFTARIVKTLPKTTKLVTLENAPGLRLLEKRTSATFESHEHGKARGGHDHDHDDEKGGRDGHIWLDPDNAKAMANAIAAALSERSPADAPKIRENAARLASKLDALAAELDRELKPVAGKPFVVFHDAYQYLETRFGLTAVGSITLNPEVQPSAKRISQVRAKVASLGAVCIFAEPQFKSRLVETVAEGTKARPGTLDPEGGLIAAGPDHYFELMRKLATSLKSCLGPSS